MNDGQLAGLGLSRGDIPQELFGTSAVKSRASAGLAARRGVENSTTAASGC